jgi:uncharacterized membrane protein YeiH
MLETLTLAAIAVCAITGALAAHRQRMDAIGVLALAVATALGGGTLRDLLLNNHPLIWIKNPNLLAVALGAGALTLFTAKFFTSVEKALKIADAVGLALFTVLSTDMALSLGYSPLIAIVMGIIGGVAGGVLRDVLSNQIPFLFMPGEFYATASLAGALTTWILKTQNAPHHTTLIAGALLCLAARLGSIWYKWKLPELPRSEK